MTIYTRQKRVRDLNATMRKHKLKHKRSRALEPAAARTAIPAQTGVAEVGDAVEGA